MILDIIKSKGESKGAIIYFHTGGMICSTSRELQDYQIELLKDYDIYLLEYRLAPKYKFDEIIDDAYMTVDEVFKKEKKVIFFAKSAGCYIAMSIYSRRYIEKKDNALAMILFYGYYKFSHKSFIEPSKYYQNYNISSEMIDRILQKDEISLMNRTIIYIYTRAQGTWLDFIGMDTSNLDKYSLEEYLDKFPRTYIATALRDTDVDSSNSLSLHSKIRDSKLYTVDRQVHMFDQEENEDNIALFEDILEFINI